MICADFKTIKSFCRKISKWSSLFVKWSQHDHVLSDRTFWIFSHFWSFLLRIQLVRAKVTLNSDRKYYKRDVMMMMIEINHDDQWEWWSILFYKAKECFYSAFFRSHDSSSSSFFVLTMIIIFCLSRWSYCAICFWELFVVKRFMHFWECFVFYYQSFFINVFLEKSTMSSSLVWTSLRCLNCSSSFVARRYLNTLTINSKMSKRVNKFVSRLFAHIFSLRSSNFEHFSNLWCIVCLLISHEHLEDSIVFILWK
jgi:hypothetical protein